jgi:hypothetical protein
MKRALFVINRRTVLAGLVLAALSGAAIAQPAADPLPSWNDTGPKKAITDFVKSRVFGIGPQIGYLFPAADMQGYINLRGYWEFGAENRPEGWNMWLTFALSPAAPGPTPTPSTRK